MLGTLTVSEPGHARVALASRTAGPAFAPRSAQQALMAAPARECWARTARRFASVLLSHWRLGAADRDSAILIVGELVANAAQHGRSDMTLRLTLHPHVLDIAVADHGGPLPRRASRCEDADEHGRGIDIVRALATWVEILQDETGRQVRAGLSVTVPHPRAF
ncbi:anti-sigma regulatory factor (Ser/Thr protein kinase) [Streptacidiphilus sp. MAP12-16]|uniref:ATP-binding protein n=1 Tax=Streptacidiphilus sp. MAP12-16 TaxID=3156300 RepID=UPI0035174A9D